MSNIGNIIDGLKGKSSSSYGFVYESGECKTIAGVGVRVNKEDDKVIDEDSYMLFESFINEGEGPKYADVEDLRIFKLDKDNACVIFKYDGKYIIQGVQNGDDEVNLECESSSDIKTYIERLKEAGFKEENVSKEDMQKEFEKLSESYILEKVGDRKKFSKREERVGRDDFWAGTHSFKIGNRTHTYDVTGTDSESNDAKTKVAKKVGGKMVKTAAKGALIKYASSKGILTGLIAAGATTKGGVAGAALAVKVCTAIPMAGFGGLALAGAGVAAGAAIAHKVVKKSIEKAESNVNRGYKSAWGKYYKKDGKEWVQIDKKEYYKLKEKEEPKDK